MSTTTLPAQNITSQAKGRSVRTLEHHELNELYMAGRAKEMIAAIEAAKLEFENWERADDGAPVADFHRACLELIEVWSAGAIPPSMLPAVGPIEQLAEKFLKHVVDNGFHVAINKPSWAGFGGMVEQAYTKVRDISAERLPLESVAELLAQKVTSEQIARMHGLTVFQVESEKKNPGSVCKADYVAPVLLQQEKQSEDDTLNYSNGAVLCTSAAKLKRIINDWSEPAKPLSR